MSLFTRRIPRALQLDFFLKLLYKAHEMSNCLLKCEDSIGHNI
jgi:hypothetical protein